MAKDDFLSLLMINPDDAWKNAGKKPKEPKPIIDPIIAAKAKLVKGIDTTIEMIKSGVDNPPRGWYLMKGDLARVTIKVGVKIMPIAGRTYNAVPRERAADFYNKLQRAVINGALDSDIRKLIGARFVASSRKPRIDAGKKRQGWSDERRAKQAATVAARNTKSA
jgi:hypothetical protein